MALNLPARGFVFWTVGSGDSTTVKVNDNVVMQVDIHNMTAADEDDNNYHPVVDHLVDDVLPEVGGDPYLAVFALTHADKDHCKGFQELLDRVTIGELWFTPRVLRDFQDYADDNEDVQLAEDAQAFCAEAERRVALNQGTEAESGDRIRIIGNDDILDEDDYKDIPANRKTRPGEAVTMLDGVELDGTFRAFIHAPFGDDSTADRNRTSLAMQVTLTEGDVESQAMLLGDLDYPPLKRIFIEKSAEEDKAWDVLLAPHHCSKSAMYFRDEDDDEEVLKQDICDAMSAAGGDTGWVVASSVPVPASNEPGENPPHAKAKKRYEEIAPDGFICTGDNEGDDPLSFEVSSQGVTLFAGASTAALASSAAAAVSKARGSDEPHADVVGFGTC